MNRAPTRLAPPGLGAGGAARHAPQTAALMAWVTGRTDNPLFTHEIRTRTRSGRWADWLVVRAFGPAGRRRSFGLAYPDILEALAATSPLRFFG